MRKLPNFKGKFFLAPMAGITDYSFRKQARKYGAAYTVTELTSVEGIIRKEKQIEEVLDAKKGEQTGIQLFGGNPESVSRAGKIIEDRGIIIDFNLGCPAPHITAQEAGAALLMKKEKIHKIITRLIDSVKKPVTAKIRLGPDNKRLVYKEVAKTLEEAGISMLTIHPRTVKQGYSGEAEWNKIRELKEMMEIPVVGNGDIDSPEKAVKMLEETNCDYAMIGRAARGNPFIFKQSNDLLRKGTYESVTDEERIKAWEEYFKEAIKNKVKFGRLKVQAQQYSKGITGIKQMREKISKAKNIDELEEAMKQILKR